MNSPATNSTNATLPPLPSERLLRAIAVAAQAHDGHYRKSTRVPYISHPMAVMMIAASMTADEDVLFAALFHDILEDVPENYSEAQMRAEFGDRVVEIVQGVTKDSSLHSWKARSDAYLAHLAEASEEAIIVAVADKFHNLSSTIADLERDGRSVWDRFNSSAQDQLWWYTSVRDVIAQRLPELTLLPKLSALVEQLETWV